MRRFLLQCVLVVFVGGNCFGWSEAHIYITEAALEVLPQWQKDIWSQMTEEEQQRIKDKCNWEHMTRYAVIREWQSLIPDRLRNLIEDE